VTPEEVADPRHESGSIKVKPHDMPRPVTEWAQMGLLQAIVETEQIQSAFRLLRLLWLDLKKLSCDWLVQSVSHTRPVLGVIRAYII
jgi:hypothetical protein